MVIQQQHHGWGQTGGCIIAMMDWRHTRTNPFTLQAISAEELRLFSAEISMRELLPLALVALLVLGIFTFSFKFLIWPPPPKKKKTETSAAKWFCLLSWIIISSGLLLLILVFSKKLFLHMFRNWFNVVDLLTPNVEFQSVFNWICGQLLFILCFCKFFYFVWLSFLWVCDYCC